MPNNTSTTSGTSIGGYCVALAAASGAGFGLEYVHRRVGSYTIRGLIFGVLGATSLIGTVAAKSAGWRLFFLLIAGVCLVDGARTYAQYRGWSKSHQRQAKGGGTKSDKQLTAAEEKPALFEDKTAAGPKTVAGRLPFNANRGGRKFHRRSKSALAAAARRY